MKEPTTAPAPGMPSRAETSDFAMKERELLRQNLNGRIAMSVRRRTPFMSEAAQKELSEDLSENLFAYLREVFAL